MNPARALGLALIASLISLSTLARATWPAPQPPARQSPAREPLTPDTLQDRLAQETADGFSGAVLLVRQGKLVLDQGYGLADREHKIPNTPDTIFGIGSTPIDFTKAGILLLAQRHQLDLADPITKYFKNVPEDKRAITLDHLMTGRSGLVNFHDLPSDANPDHTWIDRDEAVRRIFATTLLFPPGQGNQHSHSAYGLLAAVIEIVSGQSYPDFLRRELFTPAGMKDTGFFGEPLPPERTAIGYGKKSGPGPNSPPNWGKTSWLVMGSGGMTSTTRDLRRWFDAMNAGRIIPAALVQRSIFRPGSMLAGGDMHGYEIIMAPGADALLIIVTNSFESPQRSDQFRRLAEDLATLVAPPPAPYALGVEFAVQDDGVKIARVAPGGAAEAGGLRADDRIISVNATPIGPEPRATLAPLLQSRDPIAFEIQRGDQKLTIKVTPKKR